MSTPELNSRAPDANRDVAPTRRVAIVVVNYGSSDLLERNLRALTRECGDITTVVVDNYSTSTERERIQRLSEHERWRLVLSDNVGFGAGVNAGVAEALDAGSDAFLLLNPDASISCVGLGVLAERLRHQPFTVLAPMIVRPDGSTWSAEGALTLDRGRTLSRAVSPGSDDELPWISGACLMIGREVWEAVGGFDEDYFLYWEDVDLSVRAMKAGAALEVVHEVRAVHDEGGTQLRSSASDFSWDYYYYNIRNRLLFAAKLLESSDRRRWYRRSLRESYRILLRGGGRRKFLRPHQPVSCALKAMWDGWRWDRGHR